MYISLAWLGRHVDIAGIDPEKLALDLTLSTAEVEGLEPVLPELSGVVVGHVLDKTRHPNADRLNVCRVAMGASDAVEIVCGAPNVAVGQKVAVAPVGTELPGGLKIQKAELRGVTSLGMICSEKELGLSEEGAGIWVLPAESPVGVPVDRALGLQDYRLKIDNKSLTHRPDLWGHRGMAREVAALYRRPLKRFDAVLPPLGNRAGVSVNIAAEAGRVDANHHSAHDEAHDEAHHGVLPGCSRYLALELENVAPLPSPLWLRFLLLAVGQRSINQIVDVSNFVMFDLGQPNHTFDRAQLSPQGIVVRNARAGETLKTLDGVVRKLSPDDLLICSGEEPVALAGVMGGAGAEVSSSTGNLLLEVATFSPGSVRRTSVRHALRTESSARFEKTLDPLLASDATALFARTILELQPDVRFPSSLTDAGSYQDPSRHIVLHPEHARRALGAEVSGQMMRDTLVALEFGVETRGDTFDVRVPSFRATKDITIERDLVEEIGRIYGYGNIPEQKLVAPLEPAPKDERRELVRHLQDRLSGAGRFVETLSYSFVSDEILKAVGMEDLPHVRLANPVADNQSRVRRSVVPSLLASLEQNRRDRELVRLFEIGKGYWPEQPNSGGEPREVHLLGLLLARPVSVEGERFDRGSFAQLRGVVGDLLSSLDFASVGWTQPGAPPAWAHPKKWAAVSWAEAEAPAVVVGVLDPRVARRLGLKDGLAGDVAIAEVSLDALLAAPRAQRRYRAVPKFPGIKVDVAVAAPIALAAAEITLAIEQAATGYGANVVLFDLYQGAAVGPEQKSLAYHVVLQADDRTLTDVDEKAFLEKLRTGLGALHAELRDG